MAIHVLAHATPHPDIFWTSKNWISPAVERVVKQSFRWSADEVVGLVRKFESMHDGGADWHRGGMGQHLWPILVADRALVKTLPDAIRSAVDSDFAHVVIRLLIWFQYLAADPIRDIVRLLERIPGLADVQDIKWVVEEVRRSGRFEVFA